MVGNDTDKIIGQLKNKIKPENRKKIDFIKKTIKISKFLENSDIGILTSNEEGLSNSILEYMSYGLPVLATKVGGNVEQVFNNKNGFLVGKDDDLKLSILFLISLILCIFIYFFFNNFYWKYW